jgi:hypothetical protein
MIHVLIAEAGEKAGLGPHMHFDQALALKPDDELARAFRADVIAGRA